MMGFGKAPRKALATMAARKSAPAVAAAPARLDISEDEDSAAEDIEEEPLSQDEESNDNILAGTKISAVNDDGETIEEENEDGDGDEEDGDEEEDDEEEEDYNQNNFLYDVP